jgi:hypothetical protein
MNKAMSTFGRTMLAQEWRQLAGAWTREAREGRQPTRGGLLDYPRK